MGLLLFNPFQPSVVFHIETVIWFTLQIMPSFVYGMLHWAEMD